jgi:hypothetical protein
VILESFSSKDIVTLGQIPKTNPVYQLHYIGFLFVTRMRHFAFKKYAGSNVDYFLIILPQ